MSEEEKPEGDDSGHGEGKKKGGLKKILMIAVPLVLLLGGAAGAYFMGYLDSLLGVEKKEEAAGDAHGEESKGEDSHGEAPAGEHGEAKEEGGHDAPAEGGHGEAKEGGHGAAADNSPFMAIPTMIINLNDEDGNPRYLRLTIQLELEDKSEKSKIESVIPKVIDQFQTYLRELRVQDLRGSAGIYRLQVELLWRVNQAVHPVKVKDVLFQEILIQ